MKVLIITNQLLTTCGVSKHLKYFLETVKNKADKTEFTLLCGGGDAVENYKSLAEVIVFEPVKHENRTVKKFLQSILFVFKLQQKNKFDIIHAHNHYAANIAVYAAKLTKIMVIQTVHGIIAPIGKLKHYPAKNIIAVNEHIKEYLINNYDFNSSNIHLIRNGLPAKENFEKHINEKLKILSAGRLIEEKGFDVFIKAVSKLPLEIRNKAEFLIAGKGDYETQLKKINAELKAGIIFLGELKNLPANLQTTDVFVNPTRSQSEGFPVVITEAALNQNLVISTKFVGCNFILKDEENCLLFDTDNDEQLFQLLDKVIRNFDDYNHLIQNLFLKVKQEYNIDRMFIQLKEVYSGLCK